MIQKRTKSNSSKVNLIISAVFHTVLVGAIFYFAAKEGLLGKKLKELTVTMEKVKKPEPPKDKPEPPKIDQPKQVAKVSVPQPQTATPPPPAASDAAPTVAPAAAVLPAFSFDEGARQVQSISNPNDIYKALVEHTLRSYWNRPEDMPDDQYAANVELTIDKSGYVADSRWINGSGNTRWDDTVKQAVAQLKAISRPPPKGFPDKFTVRFDVESTRTEAIQLGIR
ncbi:MAG TPA: TonB C-terminal domain-containing protein [Verrucomicrobiae bacterium]|jgi:outer membrane biosynthesis protein TonB|nr:TonB C-terminal domain-containing protein [Verrucomicrobiae bacterium]